MQQQINEIKSYWEKKGVVLTPSGNFAANHDNFNVEKIAFLVEILPLILEKTKHFPRYAPSSYGLKHDISDILRTKFHITANYMTNGDFIMALLLLGFEVNFGPKHDNNINCKIKCKIRPHILQTMSCKNNNNAHNSKGN